jgi:hypothetical protein
LLGWTAHAEFVGPSIIHFLGVTLPPGLISHGRKKRKRRKRRKRRKKRRLSCDQ